MNPTIRPAWGHDRWQWGNAFDEETWRKLVSLDMDVVNACRRIACPGGCATHGYVMRSRTNPSAQGRLSKLRSVTTHIPLQELPLGGSCGHAEPFLPTDALGEPVPVRRHTRASQVAQVVAVASDKPPRLQVAQNLL